MPGAHPGEGAKGYKGLCVFDMDNTLTRDMLSSEKACRAKVERTPAWHIPEQGVLAAEQYPGLYAKQAVKRCLNEGFAVGVATAAPCVPPPALGDPGGRKARESLQTRMGFLKGIGMPSTVVTAQNQQGPAYQCIDDLSGNGTSKKSQMVGNLMGFYGTKQENTVFFDDQQRFLNEVNSVYPKVTTQLASSKECHGKVCLKACGLRKSEFDVGIGKAQLRSDPSAADSLLSTTKFNLAGKAEKGSNTIGRRTSHTVPKKTLLHHQALANPAQRHGLGGNMAAQPHTRLHHHHHHLHQ
eukprot:TRINITY_DN13300_c0_g1_i1.p1 TRINITY_DN13300_c0_g1~~TRINITY_DN13300_c0_g1_i1.p1  ORF type:complete len:297 (+),score=46.62 TRINITY_DN13300_c0_g1_i1:49-939(+)